MSKLMLSLSLFLVLIGVVGATVVTLTSDPNINMNYTKNTALIFSNNEFILNNTYHIKPFVSVANREYNLTLTVANFSTSITDMLFYHKWGINIKQPQTTSKISSAGFYISGCSKYSDTSLKCGSIELDFSDLVNTGYTISLTDNKIIITGIPTTDFNLDPTDQLLPNATNKAWVNSTSNTGNCLSTAWTTLTEFTSTEYGKVNVSDNNWYSLTATSALFDEKCTMDKFTFNVSAVVADLATITEIKMVHEGYYSSATESWADLWWYNGTSGIWMNFGDLNYGSDTIISKTFTSTNILLNGVATFGVKAHCFFKDAIQARTDIAYLNVTYTTVGGGVITPEGDSWVCNINQYWGDASKSMPILCSAHSNTTGQPVTGATVTCTVHSSPYFASTIQSVQTCTEKGNGMYNCTFLTANMAVNTPYIINCSCAINGVTNWYMGSTYISQTYPTSCASIDDVQNSSSVILGNMSDNFTATNLLLALLDGNMSSNFTYTNLLIAYLEGNMSLNFTDIYDLIASVCPVEITVNNTNSTTNETINNTYNYTYQTILDRPQLKNISKTVWELEPEQSLYYQWITYMLLIVLIIINMYYLLKEWRLIR